MSVAALSCHDGTEDYGPIMACRATSRTILLRHLASMPSGAESHRCSRCCNAVIVAQTTGVTKLLTEFPQRLLRLDKNTKII